jgi:hypothetical protein
VKPAARKTASTVLEDWLTDVKPEGADEVRAAVARRLAEALETAPEYSLARIAAALHEIVSAIEGISDEDEARRALQEALAWMRN